MVQTPLTDTQLRPIAIWFKLIAIWFKHPSSTHSQDLSPSGSNTPHRHTVKTYRHLVQTPLAHTQSRPIAIWFKHPSSRHTLKTYRHLVQTPLSHTQSRPTAIWFKHPFPTHSQDLSPSGSNTPHRHTVKTYRHLVQTPLVHTQSSAVFQPVTKGAD